LLLRRLLSRRLSALGLLLRTLRALRLCLLLLLPLLVALRLLWLPFLCALGGRLWCLLPVLSALLLLRLRLRPVLRSLRLGHLRLLTRRAALGLLLLLRGCNRGTLLHLRLLWLLRRLPVLRPRRLLLLLWSVLLRSPPAWPAFRFIGLVFLLALPIVLGKHTDSGAQK
jgi:hypothetical protein